MRALIGNFACRPATISSKKALLWGLFWMLSGAILGWYFSIVPTSIVDYTWGRTALINYVIYGVAMWVSLSIPTLLIALLRNRDVVVWEVFGRMLYSHIPVTFIMLPAMFGDKVAFSIFMSSPFASSLSVIYSVLMSIYVVALLVWFFYWGYVAFSRLTQFRRWSGVILYVVAIHISYLASEYLIGELMKVGAI